VPTGCDAIRGAGERRLKGFADKAQVFRFEWQN